MRVRFACITGVVALGILTLANPSQGSVMVYQNNFESDTIGGTTSPGIATVPSSSGMLTVIDTKDDTHPSPDPAGTQAMLLSSSSGATALVNFSDQRSGNVTVRLNIRVNDDTNEDYYIRLLGTPSSGSTTANFIRIRPANPQSTIGGISYINGTSSGPIGSLLRDVKVGDWYELSITVDLDSHNWGASVQNLNDSDPSQSNSVAGLNLNNSSMDSIHQLSFSRTGGTQGTLDITIDDVRVSVPEPSSLGLLGISGLMLIRRKTRKLM